MQTICTSLQTDNHASTSSFTFLQAGCSYRHQTNSVKVQKQSQRLDHHTTTTILRPFFGDHLGEPVPEENFWTLWCKGRLTETDTPTILVGATPSGLTSAHLHHPPILKGWMAFLLPNQQCQSNEGTTVRIY